MTRAIRLIEQLAGENLVYSKNLESGEIAKASIGSGAFVAIQEHETAIEDLKLETSRNVTTLSELQESVDEELLSVSGHLQDLQDADEEINESLVVYDERLVANEEAISALTLDVNAQSAQLGILESTVLTLAEQLATLTDFFTTLELDALVAKDTDGNVDLLDGKLRARVLETGALVIEVVEEDAPTIGQAMLPAGETELEVETRGVEENSRIFLTPQAGIALEHPLTILEILDGISFLVGIPEALDQDLKFNWWIVEEK